MTVALMRNGVSLALLAVIGWTAFNMGGVEVDRFLPAFLVLACLFVWSAIKGLMVGTVGWMLLFPLVPMVVTASRPLELLHFIAMWLTLVVAAHQIERDTTGRIHLLIYGLFAIAIAEATMGFLQWIVRPPGQFAPAHLSFRAGSFYNRNHFAGFLSMMVPIFLAIAGSQLHTQRASDGRESRRRRAHHTPPQTFVESSLADRFAAAWLFVLGGIFVLLAILFSLSRSSTIFALCGLVITVFVFLGGRARRRGQAGLAAKVLALCFLSATLLSTLWIGIDPLVQRFQDSATNAVGRLQLWRDTVRLIADYPWLGVGGGMYRWEFRRYQTFEPHLFFEHAHNDYLEAAAEWGIPALLFFLGTILFMLTRIVKAALRARDPARAAILAGGSGGILALLLHSITDFNLHIPSNALLFSLLLGTTYALARKTEVSILRSKERGDREMIAGTSATADHFRESDLAGSSQQ